MLEPAMQFIYALFAVPFQWVAALIGAAVGMALLMALLIDVLSGESPE